MAKDNEDSAKLVFVGVASSAGGLEATTALVKNLPDATGAVYVVAQHMAPKRESLLTSLLARETQLSVVELKGNQTTPVPNTIYIPPPNSDVVVQNGQLCLVAPGENPATPKPSADRLFISIAEYCGSECVGIVLSGTGSDGSYGVQAIREVGGVTIAQEPVSAKFDGMPASAIATGCIDLTLAPESMGLQLGHVLERTAEGDFHHPVKAPVELHQELMNIMLARTKVDFSNYKEQTVFRRIRRRMDARSIDDFDTYVELCRTSPVEVDSLHRDLLISVTRFFRDPSQFRQLSREIKALVDRYSQQPLRIWVAGCASGEEAYTIAILVAEAYGGLEQVENGGVQIFATDIDEHCLEIARKGTYPITAANDVPSDMLEKYFKVSNQTIQVKPELRAITLFSRHNVFQDPPFINIDLVSLRNLLIYFKPKLQDRVLSRVHYALKQEGLLFLGTSEAIRSMDLFFENKQETDKIYIKRHTTNSDRLFPADVGLMDKVALPMRAAPPPQQTHEEHLTQSHMFDALARSVAPNGFIITRKHDIVRVFGDVTPFLELTEESSLRLSIRILKRGLRDEIPGLVAIALKNKETREGRWHHLEGANFNQVKLMCYPVVATAGEDHILIAFRTRKQVEETTLVESLSDRERTQYILQIESEMQSTREALQQTVEELQTSNEELQSVNEELQSTNEELQATNEELETSNEELQSTNEELITVNEEMQVNSAEHQKVMRELSGLLAASPNPLMVVDYALLVRRASNSALDYFNLSDLPVNGVHLSQLHLPGNAPMLTSIASEVYKSQRPISFELEKGERIHTIMIAPFKDAGGNLLGLTLSIYDYDAKAMAKKTEAIEQMGEVWSWSYNESTRTLTFSPDMRRTLGLPIDNGSFGLLEAERMLHPNDRDQVRRKIDRAIQNKSDFRFEARCVHPTNRVLHVQVTGMAIVSEKGNVVSFVGAVRDVTSALTTSMLLENIERLQSTLGIGIFSYDVENDETFLAGEAFAMMGIPPGQRATKSLDDFVSAFQKDDRTRLQMAVREVIRDGGAIDDVFQLGDEDNAIRSCRVKASTRTRADGGVSHIYGTMLSEPADGADSKTDYRESS